MAGYSTRKREVSDSSQVEAKRAGQQSEILGKMIVPGLVVESGVLDEIMLQRGLGELVVTLDTPLVSVEAALGALAEAATVQKDVA